ncbi:hypothetical protein ACJJTC_012903 [Scirpophaga incertulas]
MRCFIRVHVVVPSSGKWDTGSAVGSGTRVGVVVLNSEMFYKSARGGAQQWEVGHELMKWCSIVRCFIRVHVVVPSSGKWDTGWCSGAQYEMFYKNARGGAQPWEVGHQLMKWCSIVRCFIRVHVVVPSSGKWDTG